MRKIIIPVLIFAAVWAFYSSSTQSPKPGEDLGHALPATLVNSEGKPISLESLKGKYIGIYFSAHWCPPCQVFTPALVKFRDANVNNGFEVVFVSADHSEEEKSQYIRETGMKWPNIPGIASPQHQKMAEIFGVSGIPTLAVLSPEGAVVSMSGVDDVMTSPDTALTKWQAAAKLLAQDNL